MFKLQTLASAGYCYLIISLNLSEQKDILIKIINSNHYLNNYPFKPIQYILSYSILLIIITKGDYYLVFGTTSALGEFPCVLYMVSMHF